MTTEERYEIDKRKILFFLSLCCMFLMAFCHTCTAYSITDYTEENTNSSIHIKTEEDLSQNYTVLFNNMPLEYTVFNDIIITGLEANTEYTILISGDNGKIQTIQARTLEGEKIPFYLAYGVIGLFIFCMIMLVLGYLIPFIELINMPLSIIGFITAIKTEESYFIPFLFVLIFAISALIFGYYGNKGLLR